MLHPKKLSKMSLLIAAGLAASMVAYPAMADDAPPPPPGNPPAHEHGPRVSPFERLETQLKLTDAETANVHPVLADAETQTNALRKDKSLTMDQKRDQRLQIVEGLPAKLNPYLDDTQKATLAKFVERMQNPPQHRPRGDHGNPPPAGAPAPAPAPDQG